MITASFHSKSLITGFIFLFLVTACSPGNAIATSTPFAVAINSPVRTPKPTATADRPSTPAPLPSTPTANVPQPTPSPNVPANLPIGFPLASDVRPWRVIEGPEGRDLVPPKADGPTALEVAHNVQGRAQNDLEANAYGWDCRTHATYEGAPAVDWYLTEGTAVQATMDGQAELSVITPLNSFAYYGVNPHLYLGLPSPQLPLYPFNGPSGGMGVFVSILNGKLRAEYGHLNLEKTLSLIPGNAFISPYSPDYAYEANFKRPLNPGEETVVARWPVKRGQTIGFVGNTGYSDVPHLHYQIIGLDRKTKYCPTQEPLSFSGWLFGPPAQLP